MKSLAIVITLYALCAGSAHAQMSKSDLLIQRLASPSGEVRKSVSSDLYGSGGIDKVTLEAIAELVTRQLPTLTAEDDRADEIAWHLKTLGASADERYRPLIEQALASPSKQVARYSRSALETLALTSKSGFPLLTRDKVREITDRQAEGCVYIRNEECATVRSSSACVSELKYQSMEAGGDSIMLMRSEGRGWSGRTRLSADLYNCRGNFTKNEGGG